MPRTDVNPQAGFSLLEIMTALTILTTGMLGSAGLQINALKNTYSAHLRTEVILLGQSMIEQLRAQHALLLDNPDIRQLYRQEQISAPGSNCHDYLCTPTELAGFQLDAWHEAVHQLPGGRASIQIAEDSLLISLIIMWDDGRQGATGTGCSGKPEMDLRCMYFYSRL